jgi:SARP family transcriptional regulator, regulator of embCAB operon
MSTAQDAAAGVRIGVLGPLSVTVDGRTIVPTAAKPRTVLAMLAVRSGQVVTFPTLLTELWGADPPASATTTLQTYIFQLRRDLRRSARTGPLIATVRGGYRLAADPDATDVRRYRRLRALGERAALLGAADDAARLLRDALRTWRGPALVDVERGPALDNEVQLLELERAAVQERCIDAELALGRHAELLGELAVLTAQNRTDERLCAQHMLALYRCGRRLEALMAFQRLRAEMVAELGVEPGSQLRRLQSAVMSCAPELDPHPDPFQLFPG